MSILSMIMRTRKLNMHSRMMDTVGQRVSKADRASSNPNETKNVDNSASWKVLYLP